MESTQQSSSLEPISGIEVEDLLNEDAVMERIIQSPLHQILAGRSFPNFAEGF